MCGPMTAMEPIVDLAKPIIRALIATVQPFLLSPSSTLHLVPAPVPAPLDSSSLEPHALPAIPTVPNAYPQVKIAQLVLHYQQPTTSILPMISVFLLACLDSLQIQATSSVILALLLAQPARPQLRHAFPAYQEHSSI